MKKYISIGEMAKLNNISIQALRHYDKIGLLKPSYIDENSNYRYYAIDQIPYVEVIKNLKYIGLSLEEIRNIVIESESLEELLVKLEEQQSLIDKKIEELKNIKSALSHKIHNIKEGIARRDFGSVYLKKVEERKCVYLSLDHAKNDITDDDSVILALRNLGLILEKENIIEGCIGVTSVIQENKVIYEDIFILIEEISSISNHKNIRIIPGGEYLCILYRGVDTNSESYYKKLLKFIEENNYKVHNKYYEISLISGIATVNSDDYIVEIQILIK
jgi:DNA-binding transcriptional MerR regulator/effector-binding domain-containing protein